MNSKLLTSFSLTNQNLAEQVQWTDYSKQFRNLSSTQTPSTNSDKQSKRSGGKRQSLQQNKSEILEGGGNQPKQNHSSSSLPIFLLSIP